MAAARIHDFPRTQEQRLVDDGLIGALGADLRDLALRAPFLEERLKNLALSVGWDRLVRRMKEPRRGRWRRCGGSASCSSGMRSATPWRRRAPMTARRCGASQWRICGAGADFGPAQPHGGTMPVGAPGASGGRAGQRPFSIPRGGARRG
jgi:hypothetical protein